MKLGLIDEYGITVHPIILGNGKRLFKDLDDMFRLKLLGTRVFNSGAVHLHYQPITEETNI